MPDIVVSDFFSMCGTLSAYELKIPCIINAPGPFMLMEEWGSDVPNMRKASQCCGMTCLRRSCKRACVELMYCCMVKYMNKLIKIQYDQVWMFNSFFGLEKPVCLPPNFKLIGSLDKEPSDLIESLKQKDMNLYNWLEDALDKGEDVVYVTLGSICRWQKWSINAVYTGLKNIGCRVIWSLKDEWLEILDENPAGNPKFWLSSWCPQIEILYHPAVKGGLSHCGWGGILEFVGAGVPLVTFPHFAD